MGPGMIKKALPREGFRIAIAKSPKTLQYLRNWEIFKNAKTRRENPYKTLLKLIISGPFSEKGHQNHQKALPR